MADNIFPRLEGGLGNIGPRLSGSEEETPGLSVVLTITPQRIEEDASAALRVVVTQDGQPISGATVTFTSSNAVVSVMPGAQTTNSSGVVAFSIIGISSGTTNIVAYVEADEAGVLTDALGNPITDEDLNPIVVGDGATASNSVAFVVGLPEPVTEYAAQGAGVITVEGESALADGLVAKVSRFSHADQKSIFPVDDIFMHVAGMVEKEIIFFRKNLPGPDEK